MRAEQAWPGLEVEQALWSLGYRCVAGLDEAGRGAWAGPVVAAAVILPPDDGQLLGSLHGVADSKQLTAARREALLPLILEQAVAWAVGAVVAREIDELGIAPATRRAMGLALQELATGADFLLVDYLALPDIPLPQRSLPKGDVHVLSIAAASIVAKVTRDRLMAALDAELPGYGLARHKGYGTAAHLAALRALGPTVEHRLSFAPVRAAADGGAVAPLICSSSAVHSPSAARAQRRRSP